MIDDTEIPTKNTLFLAVTRPALWAGIPIEAAVLLLISSASVLIWSNSPVYAALVVAFGYSISRLIVRHDVNAFRLLFLWGRTKAGNRNRAFWVAQREVTPEKFLPYARHVNNEMVVLDSGDIMLTFELQGRAFETADVRDLNDWHTKLNGMLRNLHDERLSIWTHLIRIRVDQYPGGASKSGFAADLDRAYFSRINRERMFINRFFASDPACCHWRRQDHPAFQAKGLRPAQTRANARRVPYRAARRQGPRFREVDGPL